MSETEPPGPCPPFIYAIPRHTRQKSYTEQKSQVFVFFVIIYVKQRDELYTRSV